jgi:FhaA, N-terminal domain/FHA domain
MAGPLAAVERFFERLFERPAARLFRASVEPVQIRRAIERTIEAERTTRAGRAYVPSGYRVLLNRIDVEALATARPELAAELANAVRDYARAHGYVLPARPSVTIDASSVLSTGDTRVFALPLPSHVAQPDDEDGSGTGNALPATANEQGPVNGDAPLAATSVFPVPRPRVPQAWLAARAPNRPVTRVAVRAGTLRIGRARDNDVVLIDDRVSRHHGQVAVRLGMLVYSDLGSTNGSYVNGGAVTEIALGPGDVLQVGNSTVTIESGP